MPSLATAFTKQVGIQYPIICGAMYPCSNPELVGAVSNAGGIGIVQPISLTFVHKHDFREGLKLVRELAGGKPIGLNLLIEKSSKAYLEKNKRWLDIALEDGVRFFVTALGNPDWVVEKVHASGGVVYHDATERKWASKAIDAGVDGLICVNNRAGGHAGQLSPEQLYKDLSDLGVPLICAGGIGEGGDFVKALELGYAGVQVGTRFIATKECKAHDDYKQAILRAKASDIILTEKITGVPVSVIKTSYIDRMGIKASWGVKQLLKGQKTKHLVRMFYSLRSFWQLKQSLEKGSSYKEFFQAGRSVAGIHSILSAHDVVDQFVKAASESPKQRSTKEG